MDILLNFLWTLAWWFIGLGIHICMITLIMVTIVWGLLFLCRLFRVPWIDGTIRGFLNRE